MSFGGLQKAFVKKCLRLMVEGKESTAKSNLVEFIGYIKSKDPLYVQYHVYDNLHRHTEKDKDLAIMFIKETISELDGYNRGDILTFNTLLGHSFQIKEEASKLDDAIHVLIEDMVSDFTYNKVNVSNAFKVVLEHVMSDKQASEALLELTNRKNQLDLGEFEYFTPKKVVRLALQKVNEEFGPLFTDAERMLFNQIRSTDDLAGIYESQLHQLNEDIVSFKRTHSDADEDLLGNIDLATKKLQSENRTLDNLLNIFELRVQLKEIK